MRDNKKPPGIPVVSSVSALARLPFAANSGPLHAADRDVSYQRNLVFAALERNIHAVFFNLHITGDNSDQFLFEGLKKLG